MPRLIWKAGFRSKALRTVRLRVVWRLGYSGTLEKGYLCNLYSGADRVKCDQATDEAHEKDQETPARTGRILIQTARREQYEDCDMS